MTSLIDHSGLDNSLRHSLTLQGVPSEKLQTYNCLEDQELREGIKEFS